MHFQNLGIPLLKNWGLLTPIFDVFRRVRNLTANLTAYILGTKHDIENREVQ